jgi:hypothetical protein
MSNRYNKCPLNSIWNIGIYGVLDSISSGPTDACARYNSKIVHVTFISYVYLLLIAEVSFALSLEKHIFEFFLTGTYV